MDIILPKIALTMASGTILEWHVEPGARVQKGGLILTFETDKTSVDVEAPADGVIRELLAAEGDEVLAGTVVARLAVDGEVDRPTPIGAPAKAEVAPAARDLAAALGVDLATIVGSGTGGRVIEADVIAAVPKPTPGGGAPAEAAPSAGAPTTAPLGFSAARMASWSTLEKSAAAPTFQLGGSLAVSRLAAMKAAGVSLVDVVALAAARVLPDHPTCHALVRNGKPETFTTPRVGVLVRQGDALLAPSYTVGAGESAAALGARRRETQQALSEGHMPADNSAAPTFVISNLGPFGVDWFTAMLYPDTAVTLAMGSMRPSDGGSGVLSVVLTCDHRLADGVDAARFLAALREAINLVPLN